MADWFDPLGVRRVADAMSTVAAQALVGREVRLNGRSIEARIVAVHEAAPAGSMTTLLAAQVGLWRRLDLTFGDVRVEQRSITSVRADGVDIRAVEALPQRIQADKLSLTVELTPDDVASWLDHIAPDGVTVRIVDRRVLARLPGLAQFGEVELEPWWQGRTMGIEVRRAWIRGRRVRLPSAFSRSYERELEWLPDSTSIETIAVDDDGGVVVTGSIDNYSIELDVPRLLVDLSARGAAGVIDVFLGRA